jgi:hypothetical protein
MGELTMKRILLAIMFALAVSPAYAQQWDQVNGSMQTKSGPAAPLVIIDQTLAGQKIISLRNNGTEKCYVDVSGNLSCLGALVSIGGVTAAGTTGVPVNVAVGRFTAQVAAKASVAAFTVGASDASFEVSSNVLVTTATTHSFTVTVTYTDEGNTSRTTTLNFATVAGVISNAAITNVAGAVPYEGVPYHIRCKAATTITVATTGTFTAVAYNVEGIIKQIS